jgi:hypothetical protein
MSYAADPHIAVSAFTTTINKHSPSDRIQQLNNDIKKIYFFTDLRNFQGQTLTHEWSYNGWVAQRIPFVITGSRWRVSSNKSLKPRGKGTWTVKILDGAGNVIQKSTISYNKKSTQTKPEVKPVTQKDSKKEIAAKEKKKYPADKDVSKTTSAAVEKKEKAKIEISNQKTPSKKDVEATKETQEESSQIISSPKDVSVAVEGETKTTEPSKDVDSTTVNSSSSSSLPSVAASDANKKEPDVHIGDCDDEDEDVKSTGKQQVTDE